MKNLDKTWIFNTDLGHSFQMAEGHKTLQHLGSLPASED